MSLLPLACSRSETKVIDPQFPDQVTLIGAVFLDDRGELAAASGLFTRTPGEPLRISLEDKEGDPTAMWLYGFTAADLSAFTLPAAAELEAGTLFLARDDGPALPEATWTSGFQLEDGDQGPALPPPAPRINAPWLPACPRLIDGTASVDFGCSPGSCAATATQQGCRLVINASPCVASEIFVEIDGRGGLLFPAIEGASGCRQVASEPQAIFTALCDDPLQRECRLRAYSAQEERFEISPVSVASGPEELTRARPPRGYISGVVARNDHVFAATFADRTDDWTCTSTAPSRIVVLDPETLQELDRAAAPPCLTSIAADPIGAGVIGVFGGPARGVGRFDERGVLTASAAIDDPRLDADHSISVLLTDDAPALIAVAVSRRSREGQGYVVVLDPETLAPRDFSQPYGPVLVSLVHVARGEVAAADDELEAIYFVDSTARETRLFGLRDTCGTTPLEMADMVANGRLIHMPSQHSMGEGLYTISEDRCTRASAFQGPTIGSGLAALDQTRLVVGLSERRPPRRGFLALFDADRNRYLPGLSSAGAGVVSYLRIDDRGRVWGATPGTGHVFRAVPK